jgi:PKD repeat protein
LTYTWDFGDGNGSTQASPNHIFLQGGTFTVRVTVRDKEGSASAAVPMTIKTLTGRWDAEWTPDAGADLTLTQNGTSVSGTWLGIVYDANDRQIDQWVAPITGFVQTTTPRVRLEQAATNVGGAAGRAFTHLLEPSDDADSLRSTTSPLLLIYRRR